MKFCIRKTVLAACVLSVLSAGALACGGQTNQVISLVSEETTAPEALNAEETQEQETASALDGDPDSAGETLAGTETVSGPEGDPALEQETAAMAVYVCGAVALPGVYEVTADMRLVDLVELAGGFAAGADETYWNLACKVSDGAMYYFPTLSETADESFSLPDGEGSISSGGQNTAGSSSAGDTAGNLGSGNSGEQTGGDTTVNAGTNDAAEGLVSINTATKEELTTLPGIGDTKAAAIITYRETNGPFTSIDEIMNVTGIGESTYEKLKDYICL